MTIPAEWPRAILPADRDGRFNALMDGICTIYRGFTAADKKILGVSATVLGGDGRAEVIAWDGFEIRRFTVTDEQVA